jgi:hypothetical protein
MELLPGIRQKYLHNLKHDEIWIAHRSGLETRQCQALTKASTRGDALIQYSKFALPEQQH